MIKYKRVISISSDTTEHNPSMIDQNYDITSIS